MVDPKVKYQTIEGFGGAFTESDALVFYQLPPDKRAEILRAYFDPEHGHGYVLCRTTIGSADFHVGNYSYDEVPGDVELKRFTIDHDRKALIPFILEAMKTAPQPLKLFASPCSPPPWMKTNGKMTGGGKLKSEYRAAWAHYYTRYIHEYAKAGVPIWGLTVQNEPEAIQRWDSCELSGEEERDFVRDYLGPELRKENLGSVKLMIWDHNRDRIYERAKVVLDDPNAAQYVWGTAFHWYVGDFFNNVQLVHDAYPDKQLLFSEGCQEGFDPKQLDSWAIGERYGRSMLNDLNRWTVGWVDWNLVLDETGGPDLAKNFCFAPIIADTKSKELKYLNSYYYIGHFARFIRPGARRIIAASTRDELQTTAFLNEDGRISAVVLNLSDSDIPFALKYNGRAAMSSSPAHSILTFRFSAN
jgi:glucosylceramidase